MKFLILVNQRAVIENSLDLDIIDCAIFDCIKDFAHTPKCRKFIEGEKIYYWFSYTLIKDQLPILKGQSKKSIQRRLDNLVNAKILERHPENQKKGQSFFCFGENYPLVIFDQDKTKTTKPSDKNDQVPKSFLSDHESTKDNSIKNKRETTPTPHLKTQKTVETSKEKNCAKKEKIGQAHLFRESPYFDKNLFVEALQNLPFPLQQVNLGYYYQDLLHDSDSHQRKVHDWLAYAQKWMLKAYEMGTLQTSKINGNPIQKQAVREELAVNEMVTQKWQECLQFIENQLDKKIYQTWFVPIQPLQIEAQTLFLQVPSHFFYEYLEEHFASLLRQMLDIVFSPNWQLAYQIALVV